MVGRSSSPHAASFIRPSRPQDLRVSFIEALRNKYSSRLATDQPVEISGKIVREVGFERIQQHWQDIQNHDTIDLTGSCIFVKEHNGPTQAQDIREIDLKVRTLDLSNNLLESWADTLTVCRDLEYLRSLNVT